MMVTGAICRVSRDQGTINRGATGLSFHKLPLRHRVYLEEVKNLTPVIATLHLLFQIKLLNAKRAFMPPFFRNVNFFHNRELAVREIVSPACALMMGQDVEVWRVHGAAPYHGSPRLRELRAWAPNPRDPCLIVDLGRCQCFLSCGMRKTPRKESKHVVA